MYVSDIPSKTMVRMEAFDELTYVTLKKVQVMYDMN